MWYLVDPLAIQPALNGGAGFLPMCCFPQVLVMVGVHNILLVVLVQPVLHYHFLNFVVSGILR